MNIDGVEYVRADSVNSRDIGELRIIVADRGWVFVGRCEDNADGSVTIRNSLNLRHWGTKRGLGELVNGPVFNEYNKQITVTDPYGTVRVTPIVTIAVNQNGGWDALTR